LTILDLGKGLTIEYINCQYGLNMISSNSQWIQF